MPTIQFNNAANERVTCDVISLAGEVIEINRSNQTHLYASGGGAYASSSGGHASASVSPISVSSTNSVHDDVYILTDTGEEIFFQLVNWEAAGIRKGHHIQAIWLRVTIEDKGSFSTPYVIVNNRSLGKVLYNEAKLLDVVKPSTKMKTLSTAFNFLSPIAKGIAILFAIICIVTILLIPLIGIGYVVLINKLLAKLPVLVNSEVKPKLNALLLPPISRK